MPTSVELADEDGAKITASNPLPVDILVGGSAPTLGAGTAATAQRVTLASDDPGVTALQIIDNTQGSKAPGTAASQSNLGGAVYTSAGITPTDGQQAALQMDAAGRLIVSSQGNVASAAADSGNPVKTGTKFNSTQPTFTDGQRGEFQMDNRGNQKVTLVGGTTAVSIQGTSAGGEGVTNSNYNTLPVISHAQNWNGASWDRAHSNRNVTVFSSAARTGTPTPFDGVNYNAVGLHLVIDCTSVTSSPSVTFTIQGGDAVSGKYYTVLASAAIVGTGTTILRVYPGLTAAGNLVASDILPRTWRVIATHGNSDSITYSVGASLI